MSLAEVLEDERIDDGFIVDNDEKANWVLRKVASARQEHARQTTNIRAEIERLNAINTRADHWVEQEEARLLAMLMPYTQTVREKGRSTKTQTTYALPHGKIKIKHAAVKLEKTDDLLPYLKETGQTGFIRVKEEPAWSDIKSTLSIVDGQVVTADGEIFERGVAVVEMPEAFVVETDTIKI